MGLLLCHVKTFNVLSTLTYSPSHRQVGAPVVNIQSTFRTAADLCKNVSLAVLFGKGKVKFTLEQATKAQSGS